MKDKKNIILCISLIIVIAFSMLLFFGMGELEKTGIQISAFIFTILTEVIVFGNVMILTSNKKLNTFLIAGLSSTTFLYAVASLLFNVLLSGVFTTLRGILVFNFSLLLIYLFTSSIILLFKKEDD